MGLIRYFKEKREYKKWLKWMDEDEKRLSIKPPKGGSGMTKSYHVLYDAGETLQIGIIDTSDIQKNLYESRKIKGRLKKA